MKSPEDSFSSYPLSHGLERLSPRKESYLWNSQKQDKFVLACCLYALFPCLEEIIGEDGSAIREWEEIDDLVKVCQRLNRSAWALDALWASDGAM
jgi:hypothetical protein